MQNESRYHNDVEIDLHQYVEVLKKRKKAFFAVFLLVVISGFAYLQFSPKIYKVSMLIQSPTLETDLPVSASNMSDKNDLETAEKTKFLILSNFFNVDLAKEMKVDLSASDFKFSVEIPQKTNVLKISTIVSEKEEKTGILLLETLVNLVSDYYTKRVDFKSAGIINQIKQNERAIENAKERIKNVQGQIAEIEIRKQKLFEEIKAVSANTAEMLSRREEMTKNNSESENIAILFLSNIIQTNLAHSSQLNNQLSDLSIRIMGLNLETKTINSQISDFQMAIDKLKSSKDFISSIKIIEEPKISSSPVSPDKKKILGLSILMGFVLGVTAAFVQEFWHK